MAPSIVGAHYRIPEHGDGGWLEQVLEQRLQGPRFQHKVAELWAVASHVAQAPRALLADVRTGAQEELRHWRNGAGVNDLLIFEG